MEIPGYELIDTLGEGSQATVYLAVGELMERELALKLVKPKICSYPDFTESFLYRAHLLRELEHPNIVEVFDFGQLECGCYLAMAYIVGRTLKHRRFELTLLEQLAVVRAIAGALDYAHNRGCDHGRLNPDNVILRDRDHQVIVTDFVMGRAPIVAGESPYISPEQQQGQKGDHRSDLYSLGAILLLLLGGRVPWEDPQGEDQKAEAEPGNRVVGAPEFTEWALPEGLSVFQPIIERLLAPAPENRYQSGAELIAALNEITETQLEVAARDQALASLNEAQSSTSPRANLDVSAERDTSEAVTASNTSVNSESAETEPQIEPESKGGAEDLPDKSEVRDELAETSSGPSESESQAEAESHAGVLRVWEQDRIDKPFESEPPSRWLLAWCGLGALILVGAVLLAAALD